MRSRILLLFISLFFLYGMAFANDNPSEAKETEKKTMITGGVVNSKTGKPISQVSVTAYVANKKEKIVMTDENGNYSFQDLKPGTTCKIVFEKDGFHKVTREKKVMRADETLELHILMEESSVDIMPGPSHFFNM